MSPDGLSAVLALPSKLAKLINIFSIFMSAYITRLSALTPNLVKLVAPSMKLLPFQNRAQINPPNRTCTNYKQEITLIVPHNVNKCRYITIM